MTMHALDRVQFPRIDALLRDLPINTLFARAVVRGHAPGRVFGDDARFPRAFYVAHAYGMSLLFGHPGSGDFTEALGRYLTGEEPRRRAQEWLQVWPDDWNGVLKIALGERLIGAESPVAAGLDGGRIVRDTRVNFLFDPRRYARTRASMELPSDCAIIDDVEWIYERMKGSVVPSVFWDTADGLRERGAAFGLLYRGELASAAFASFAMDDMLELGIETVERFRGRGFAGHAAGALIDYCLARGLEPVWACRLSNVGSYRLALRLGFVHARSLPYYRLPLPVGDRLVGTVAAPFVAGVATSGK